MLHLFALLLSNLMVIFKYWGWVKRRYREIFKQRFDEAKRAAEECLDACPPETIRRFFNRVWRFMGAYRIGLTGKAAEWAVRRQKSHRQVGRSGTMQIAALVE